MAITGIGGLFFRSTDTKALSAWYNTHFGINFGWEQEAGPTLIVPFAQDTDYFPADKQWMLNLRVDDIDAEIAKLRAAGIEVLTKAEWDTPETGRFGRLHDPEGNQIELWQPPED